MVDVSTSARTGTSYVEWGAVFAGALAASAISFVLLTAGASLGLSLVLPYGPDSNAGLAASLAAFWSFFVPVLAFLVGGYIAGRMRAAWDAAASDEVDFRDGIHGLLVWSLSVVAGGLLAFLAASTAAQTTGRLASTAMSDRGTVLAPAIDTLFGASVAQALSDPTVKPAGVRAATGGRAVVVDADARAAVSRTLVAAAADRQISADRKLTLTQIVAERTGLSQPEAEKRVEQAYVDAQKALEKARKTTVMAGMGTVTALLIGLVAAWYAAQRGGHHRDNSIPPRITRTRRLPVGIS
jgi:hypothetical protein